MNSLFHWAGCLSAGRFHRRSFVLQGRHRVYATCPARGHHERWRRTEKSAEDSPPRVTEVSQRPEDRRFTLTDYVSPRYFDTVGMRFLRGRTFSEADHEGSLPVALVNEAFVRERIGGAGRRPLAAARDLNPGPLGSQQEISITYKLCLLKTQDLTRVVLDAKWTPKRFGWAVWTPRGLHYERVRNKRL